MFKKPRVRDEKHCDFIRSLSCATCGDNTSTEAAHIRMGDPRAAKRPTGMQEKPDDRWVIPLCGRDHREQHHVGERAFWAGKEIDPIFLALALYGVSGDHEAGEQIIQEMRH